MYFWGEFGAQTVLDDIETYGFKRIMTDCPVNISLQKWTTMVQFREGIFLELLLTCRMAGPCSPCTRGRCTRWSPRWCRRGGWPPRPPGRSPPSPQHCDRSRSRLSGLERIETLLKAVFYILCLVCCHLAIWGWGWEDWWWTEWTPLETSLSTLHFIKMTSWLNISSKKVDSIYTNSFV